jgi:hypothetical protein
MITDKLWSDIVGSKTYEDGGMVGDLLELGKAHIDTIEEKLTQDNVGQVYAALIQTAIQTGVQTALQKEALNKDLVLKEENIKLAEEKVQTMKLMNGLQENGTVDPNKSDAVVSIKVKDTNRRLVERQIIGLDDNRDKEILKVMTEGQAMLAELIPGDLQYPKPYLNYDGEDIEETDEDGNPTGVTRKGSGMEDYLLRSMGYRSVKLTDSDGNTITHPNTENDALKPFGGS